MLPRLVIVNYVGVGGPVMVVFCRESEVARSAVRVVSNFWRTSDNASPSKFELVDYHQDCVYFVRTALIVSS